MQPLDKMREELVVGAREPRAEELGKSEEYKVPLESKEAPKLNIEELKTAKGVPKFWLTAMKNDKHLIEFIKEHDEPILTHLINVRHEILEENVIFI